MTKLNFSPIYLILLFISFNAFSQNPQEDGRWSNPIPFDIVPVSVANLPDGRLITWSSKYHDSFGGQDGFTFTQLFDPSIGTDGGVLPRIVTDTKHDMFCPGITNLADGRILATGGSSSEKASIYDYKTEKWTSAANLKIPRGYHGAVTVADGSAFTIGGSWSGGRGDKDAEIWTEATGWRLLPGLNNELLWNENDFSLEPRGDYRIDNHAWLWSASNGKVFHAGPSETMHWFDVSGNGSFEVVGKRGDDTYSMNGNTVMFDIDKILKVGGSTTYGSQSQSSEKSYVIDINDENNVTVTPTANQVKDPRVYATTVVLPNGEVVLLGGISTSRIFSDAGARLTAEIYNPKTNSFRTAASMKIPRTYHSSGILLNDGRIFIGGGGLCGNCGDANHLDAEIYSPPYLFDDNGSLAARPNLSAPAGTLYNTILPVTASTDVSEFVFIRMSSATHSVNNEQRRVPVSFSGSNGNYQLNIPNENIMPPGYYMLFAMNNKGVPSISEAVLIGTDVVEVLTAPNPADYVLYAYFDSNEVLDMKELNIYNTNNSLVKTFNNPAAILDEEGNYVLIVRDIPSGTYMLEGVSLTGSYTKEIIIQRENDSGVTVLTDLNPSNFELYVYFDSLEPLDITVLNIYNNNNELIKTFSDPSRVLADDGNYVLAIRDIPNGTYIAEGVSAEGKYSNEFIISRESDSDVIMLIAPNPAIFEIYVYFNSLQPLEITAFNIYDTLGREVKTFNNALALFQEDGNYLLPIAELPAGSYIVEGVTASGEYQKTVIIEN